jgi:uncharacterized C2H2 Zn-finger protein
MKIDFNLIRCKILFNRIEKYQKYKDRVINWIKEDSKELNERLKKINLEDYYKFIIKTGYVTKDQIPGKKKGIR